MTVEVHSTAWDIFAVDNKFYIVRNDTSPRLYMEATSLREGTGIEISELPDNMGQGDHYFGVHGKFYRIRDSKIRTFSNIRDAAKFNDDNLAEESQGGTYYSARRDGGKNYVYKITKSGASGNFTYKVERFDGVKDFKNGTKNKKYDKEFKNIPWEAKCFWAEGDYNYCLIDEEEDGVTRLRATSMDDLFNKPKKTGMSQDVVAFMPGGFINKNSFVDGDWELFKYFDGPYEETHTYQRGVVKEEIAQIASHWKVAQSSTVKISSNSVLSAVASAEAKHTTESEVGGSISNTFSTVTEEIDTVTKVFSGPIEDGPGPDYYWLFNVKSGGKTLSRGLGQAITHTNEQPVNPFM